MVAMGSTGGSVWKLIWMTPWRRLERVGLFPSGLGVVFQGPISNAAFNASKQQALLPS
jgi:hypothetical protein